MVNSFEEKMQRRLKRVLDGPATLRIAALKYSPGQYRSPALALAVWLLAFFRSFLSWRAIAILPGTMLILLFAPFTHHTFILGMILFLPLLVLVEFFGGLIFRPKVNIQRTVPVKVRQGAAFVIRYQLENKRRLPALDLHCDPFRFGPEITASSAGEHFDLPGKGRMTVTGKFIARQRGSFSLYPARVRSGFPFGLLGWSCKSGSGTPIIIHPAFTPLQSFDLPFGRQSRMQGESRFARNTFQEAHHLKGIREFQVGDDLRRIDWKGSARHNKLLLKEFEAESFRKAALFLDTARPKRPFLSMEFGNSGLPLEAAISLTAAITAKLTASEAVVELLASGDTLHRIEAGNGAASFEAVCDLLSTLGSSDAPLPDAGAELFSDFSRIGAAVILLQDDTPERRQFVQNLQQRGIPCRIFLISERKFNSLPENWKQLSPQEIIDGKVRCL